MSSLEKLLRDRLFERGPSHRNLKKIHTYDSRFLTLETEHGLKKVINFASNDYLGLSNLKENKVSSSQPSSRLLSGNLLELENFEKEIAELFHKGSATIMQSGFMANFGLLSCLGQEGDLILADHSIHASLIDGMRLSTARWKRFKHCDIEDLEKVLKNNLDDYKHVWVIVESLFSMDGDHFPLEALVALKQKYGFTIVLDEAHGFGVYGASGKGLADQLKLLSHIDILTFNFSKSLALQGGVILGPEILKKYLINRCRPLIYSTATPWSHLENLQDRFNIVKQSSHERTKLEKLSQYAAKLFSREQDLWSPIIPIMIGDHDETKKIAESLLVEGIFCPAILYPTVEKNKARLRVSLNSSHELEDIETLHQHLSKFKQT